MIATWFSNAAFRWALIVVMSLAALLSLTLAGRTMLARDDRDPDAPAVGIYVSDVEADIGHCVMLSTMVLMVIAIEVFIAAAWFRIILVTFSVSYAIILAIRLARARRGPRPPLSAERAGGAAYHMIAGLAMLATVLPSGEDTSIPGVVMSGMAMGAHVHASSRAGTAAVGAPPAPWLLAILTVVFLIDAGFTAYVAAARRNPNQRGARLPRSIRVAVVPHIVMGLGMSLMILATL